MFPAATAPSNRRHLSASVPDLTIVVPTRNEAGNVLPLLAQLEAAVGTLPAEGIVDNDSEDETPAEVQAGAKHNSIPVSLYHRPTGDRVGGLGGAVKLGFDKARGRHVAVMDGDLQHPPALLPALVAEAQRTGADVVIASR